MRRFVVDHILPDQGVVLIEGAEARHIAKALRMEPGDEIVVMDSEGMRYHGLIQSIGTSRVAVEVKGPIATPDTPPLDMVLCQAVLKAKAMDLVIQKVTELGASRIVPFLSRRTVIRLDEKRGENNLKRGWTKGHFMGTRTVPGSQGRASTSRAPRENSGHGGTRGRIFPRRGCSGHGSGICANQSWQEDPEGRDSGHGVGDLVPVRMGRPRSGLSQWWTKKASQSELRCLFKCYAGFVIAWSHFWPGVPGPSLPPQNLPGHLL